MYTNEPKFKIVCNYICELLNVFEDSAHTIEVYINFYHVVLLANNKRCVIYNLVSIH